MCLWAFVGVIGDGGRTGAMSGKGRGTGLFDVGAVFEGLAEPGEEAEDNDDEGHGGWVFLGYG